MVPHRTDVGHPGQGDAPATVRVRRNRVDADGLDGSADRERLEASDSRDRLLQSIGGSAQVVRFVGETSRRAGLCGVPQLLDLPGDQVMPLGGGEHTTVCFCGPQAARRTSEVVVAVRR